MQLSPPWSSHPTGGRPSERLHVARHEESRRSHKSIMPPGSTSVISQTYRRYWEDLAFAAGSTFNPPPPSPRFSTLSGWIFRSTLNVTIRFFTGEEERIGARQLSGFPDASFFHIFGHNHETSYSTTLFGGLGGSKHRSKARAVGSFFTILIAKFLRGATQRARMCRSARFGTGESPLKRNLITGLESRH